MRKQFLLSNLLLTFLIPFASYADSWSPFGKQQHFFTSSFLESRGSRYHAGIDFSTENQEGLPIYAPEKGEIIRLRLSPFGYGKAVYYRGESGTLYVFAHLSGFANKIWPSITKRLAKKDFYKLDWRPKTKPTFEKGEVLCFSGSTGIGDPHLHVETRTAESLVHDPIQRGMIGKDTIAPDILGVKVLLNDLREYYFPNKKGEIEMPKFLQKSIAHYFLHIVDYARETRENPMSVPFVRITNLRKEGLYSRDLKTQSYSTMKQIQRDIVPFPGDSTGDFLYLNPKDLKNVQGFAWREFSRPITIESKDHLGNQTLAKVVWKNPKYFPPAHPFKNWKSAKAKPKGKFQGKGWTLEYETKPLAFHQRIYWKEEKGTLSFGPGHLPLKNGKLCIESQETKGKGIFYQNSKKKWNSFSSRELEEGKVCSKIPSLGTWQMQEDLEPPVIGKPTIKTISLNGKDTKVHVIPISDSGSGIGNSDALRLQFLNQWSYFEYNPEGKELYILPTANSYLSFQIQVIDDFGNQIKREFKIPQSK